MRIYRAFGLNLGTDLEFPELAPSSGDGLPSETGMEVKVDVEICARNTEPLVEFEEGSPGGSHRFLFALKGVGRFVIRDGARITYLRDAGVEDATLRLFLLGSCMAALLQQRGHVILHGNAVSVDGKTCSIIVGHSGAGKSTAAAWHYKRGDLILADDVCALEFNADGRVHVIPSYPQIKLWQSSADLLGISTGSLRRIRSEMEKFAIPLGGQFCAEPLPLKEVIELSPSHTEIASIHGMEKIRCLKEHSYRFHFLKKTDTAPDYMKKVFRLAGIVDVKRGVRMSVS